MRILRALLYCLLAAALFVACARSRTMQEVAVAPPPVQPTPSSRSFEATAYSVKGTMKSGEKTRRGVVAADPHILPIGTRIRVAGAGAYSGEYTVLDTGREIKGREIDIFMPSPQDAVDFGRRRVQVEVISSAGGTAQRADK